MVARVKIPRTFQLAGCRWRVKRKRMAKHFGKCDTNARIIYLDRGLAADVEQVTFFHELLHAIANTTGRRFDKDEGLVDAIAHLLAQAIG